LASQPTNSGEIFYSYAHEDEGFCVELKKHLANLKRQGVITEWYDRDISAGKEWNEEVEKHLNSASVILLLISPDFMNSDYCNDVEVKRAMERNEAGEARVIPVILRPVDWDGAPFSKLQGLPADAKAVTLWQNPDEAYLSVVKGIRRALEDSTIQSAHLVSHARIPRPPVVGFVARRDSKGRDIVERLKDELAPQMRQLVVLSGPGGVGKTTLAVEATRALTDRFEDRVVWIGALGREDFALSTLLDEIATQLGRADLRSLAPAPKAEEIQSLLASAATLIILDNFETIAPTEQEACVEFLLNHATCPALITTRQGIPSARNIAIPVMSPDEAEDFLQRLIEQSSDPAVFTEIDRDRIMKTSERNPLVLQWVVAQIDLAQEARTVFDELAGGKVDAAQRVFDRSFGLAQLGDDGRAALLALSLFAPDASRAALTAVSGFGEDEKRLNEAVKRLRALWLLKATSAGSRLTVEGLTRELAKARLSAESETNEWRRRFVDYFAGYSQSHSGATAEDYDSLETEKDNLVAAIDIAIDLDDWTIAAGIIDNIANSVTGVLAIHGYWEETARLNEVGLTSSRRLVSEVDIAYYAHHLAITRADQGELVEARRLYQESLEISKRFGDQSGIAGSLHQLARLAQNQGELVEAHRLYHESLEISKRLGQQAGIASGLHQLAWLAEDQGELVEARRLHQESLEIKKGLGSQHGIASSLHELARLAQNQGELVEARRLHQKSLEILKQLGNQAGIASSLHELARLAQAQGDLDEASRLYHESLEIKKRVGNQDGIALTLGAQGRVAEAEGNDTEAERLYAEALAIFEKLKSPKAEIARGDLERVKAKLK
jgi:tetratricopeptide (TPR) repeat protein